MVFNTFFSRFFMVSAAKNDSKIEVFSYFFRRRRFFENEKKTLKNLWFLLIFQVSEPPKKHPKSMPKRIQNIEEKFPKNRFCLPFCLPKPPKIDPKTTKIPPQSDVKRIFFSDAMETTRSSSESNGRHSL